MIGAGQHSHAQPFTPQPDLKRIDCQPRLSLCLFGLQLMTRVELVVAATLHHRIEGIP